MHVKFNDRGISLQKNWLLSIKVRLFGIADEEATFERRGFTASHPVIRHRLESIGFTFIHGYMVALRCTDPNSMAIALAEVEPAQRGFAFEGAAMAMALQDLLSPWRRNRLQNLLKGAGRAHSYMVYIGAGWAFARLRLGQGRYFRRMDPLLRWLAIDGYGFHEGYFHPRRTIDASKQPRGLRGYGHRAFDQGLGRSLWFVCGADAERITRTIAKLAPERHEDLWSGIGLAAAYAGGVSATDLEMLRKLAGAYLPAVAQGAAFAAKARQRAGNPTEHTELGCNIFCGESLRESAHATDAVLEGLGGDTSDQPAYEQWRQRIQHYFQRAAS
ncbi:DUF1702 family protein [Haliangium ochraceum]|uniref:UnbL n=1 Tax=Haliangium ochraceum (strain DSM 14365 / JCM 11303 / SMP-2) TaxID=502025 RepID=D0LMV5_HALO1|nr:DUF1702 family protein [Haliangium ochraceum]ACY13326.1 protein of unknown function DUF1702 [Haliangium ochraceum DSM 14365]